MFPTALDGKRAPNTNINAQKAKTGLNHPQQDTHDEGLQCSLALDVSVR